MGHRGAMEIFPENTLISLKNAIEMGVDIIEFDVHLTKDRKIVVIHDETLDRTTTGSGLISELTYDEIKRYDAGIKFAERFKGEYVPLLKEVLEIAAHTSVLLNIEIKNGPVFYDGIANAVIKEVRDFALLARTVVSSFDHKVLYELKCEEPSIAIAPLLISRLHKPISYLKSLNADGIHPRWNYLTEEEIKEFHNEGYFVNTWIVQDQKIFDMMKGWGVDAIGVNNPLKFRW